MSRFSAIGPLVCVACVRPPHPLDGDTLDDAERARLRARSNVEAARELDQGGVRSFREGRYADAVRYFYGAYSLGGPSSELWNIAKCKERQDDAEGAVAAIEQYLAQRDLQPEDRAEANREARALQARPSWLTVTTTPTGAVVTLDGKQTVGPTPVSVEIQPGNHTLVMRREGYSVESRPVQARFGRAVIVSLDLARLAK
jgi:PEGA domain